MTSSRRWAYRLAVLGALGSLLWVGEPLLEARRLIPEIQSGIIDHFNDVGPGSGRQETGVRARHSRFALGGPGFPGYVMHAEVVFWIQQSYDVRVEETFSATYQYRDGQWLLTAVSHTTGWGANIVTEDVPLGRWSHFLP